MKNILNLNKLFLPLTLPIFRHGVLYCESCHEACTPPSSIKQHQTTLTLMT